MFEIVYLWNTWTTNEVGYDYYEHTIFKGLEELK